MSPVTMTGARHAPNSEYYGKEPQLDSVYADHDRDDLELEHAVAYSTAHDANNMKRMGRSQVLVVSPSAHSSPFHNHCQSLPG